VKQAPAQVLYAGDDAGAKVAVHAPIESAGFEAVDAGPLANARLLEAAPKRTEPPGAT
jgi:8-hydroxy-5-deazaflavin:NADPH oxidoreductase